MKKAKNFNTKKAAELICQAGRKWKKFNFKIDFKKLIEIDKDVRWIRQASLKWKNSTSK